MLALAIIGLIFGAASAITGIVGGVKQANAAERRGAAEAQQYREQSAESLDNLNLVALSAGVEGDSGTAAGIREASEDAVERDIALIEANTKDLASAYRLNAWNAGLQGAANLTGSIYNIDNMLMGARANQLQYGDGLQGPEYNEAIASSTWGDGWNAWRAGYGR